MNVLLLGATDMIGQGVLRECLLDSDVQLVQTVGQTDTGAQDFEARFLFPIVLHAQVQRPLAWTGLQEDWDR
jgi:hypothetical protein